MNSQYISDDIAVVEINGVYDINTSEKYDILPISLNREVMSSSWIGKELQMVGFGITRTGREDSGYKRTADMPINDFDDQFVYVYDPSERQNVCSGDSGGAALYNQDGSWVLTGVNSFTAGDCESYFAGVNISGNLIIDGSFNFNEVIQNITTVNNEILVSTQLDISNQGTGPALEVTQIGTGDTNDVALFKSGVSNSDNMTELMIFISPIIM